MIVQPDALASDAPLMLSVSGARGIVGKTMTPQVARNFAAAFAWYARKQPGPNQPVLCIGRDSRPSGKELADAAIEGVNGAGCKAIDLGVVATPTVGVMIQHRGAAGGLVITASHNPGQWNGLKCLNSDGAAPPADHAAAIIRRFQAGDLSPSSVPSSIVCDDSANGVHISRVRAAIDAVPIRAAKLRVVLDSINGAGSIAGRSLLEQLGCEVVQINGEPNGAFAHAPEPVEANLRDLAARTRDENAACGFAQDPDADRLAIIDETGRYIGEEYTLVLAAKRVLDVHHSALSSQHSALILAANLSTSRMIDDLAAQYPNTKVVRTAVGEANVVAAMKAHGPRAIIGGEGNGGVILPSVCWVRDSLSAMALVLGLLAAERRLLSQIVNGLPRYTMIKHKFDLKKIGGPDFVATALEKVQKRFADQRLSTIDGVRIDHEDGWVHLRPSNTEPIIRLIAEAKSESRAWKLIDEVAAAAGLT